MKERSVDDLTEVCVDRSEYFYVSFFFILDCAPFRFISFRFVVLSSFAGVDRTASDVRGQFQTLLRDAGLIPRDREQLTDLNRHSE